MGSKNGDTRIEIKGVKAEILTHVAEYLDHGAATGYAAELVKPIGSADITKLKTTLPDSSTGDIDPWDAEFIRSKPDRVVFEIILAANKMTIQRLLHLGCAYIATKIKGKSPEQIKAILGNDRCTCPLTGNGARVVSPMDAQICATCSQRIDSRRRLSSAGSEVAAL